MSPRIARYTTTALAVFLHAALTVQLQYSYNYNVLVAQLPGTQWTPAFLPPSVAILPVLPVEVGGTAIVPTPPPAVPSAPLNASYLTLNAEPTLPNSRRLAAGTNVTLTDNGIGSTLQITASGGGGGGGGPLFQNITSSPYTVPVNATGSGAAYVLYNNSGGLLTVNSHNGTDSFGGNSSIVIEGFGSRTIYDYAAGNWAVTGI